MLHQLPVIVLNQPSLPSLDADAFKQRLKTGTFLQVFYYRLYSVPGMPNDFAVKSARFRCVPLPYNSVFLFHFIVLNFCDL